MNSYFYYTSVLSLLGAELYAQHQPNVIIVMTDEHNLRTLGCYRELMDREQAEIWGEGIIVETPNIDRLAQNGVLATSAYASTPVSGPARASFQTGLYPHATKVVENDIPIDGELEGFAEVLNQNGYKTIYLGKWHLAGDVRPGWKPNINLKWQDIDLMFNRGHWKKMGLNSNQEGVVLAKDVNGEDCYDLAQATETTFTTDFLMNQAIHKIDEVKAHPFCCMVSLPDPHGPNSVRAPYDTMYNHFTFRKPFTSMTHGDHSLKGWRGRGVKKLLWDQTLLRNYFGMVKCIDDNIGKLFSYLEENMLLENTIIVFTSDHGDLMGEHHRHNKGVPMEMSARVPFLVHWPKEIKCKQTLNVPLNSVDFKPTLLSLLEIKDQSTKHGEDLSSYFLNEKKGGEDRITVIHSVFSEDEDYMTCKSGWIAAISHRYKLVITANKDVNPFFIDLKEDPNELKNLFYSNDKDIQGAILRMKKALKEHGSKTANPYLKNDHINKWIN